MHGPLKYVLVFFLKEQRASMTQIEVFGLSDLL